MDFNDPACIVDADGRRCSLVILSVMLPCDGSVGLHNSSPVPEGVVAGLRFVDFDHYVGGIDTHGGILPAVEEVGLAPIGVTAEHDKDFSRKGFHFGPWSQLTRGDQSISKAGCQDRI